MAAVQEITNPDFTSKTSELMDLKNLVQCNKKSNTYKFIKTGKKYVIELPDTKTILNVKCTYAALAAADMYIISAYVDGKRDSSSETCTISYQYSHFESIHYSSFSDRENCNIYISIDDLF